VITKYISLGSILAAISVPVILVVRENVFGVDIPGYNLILPFTIGVVGLLIFTHRKNVVRLIKGTENKIHFSKKKRSK
jgi:glycerol-3-phosphate acyltransferase PlsY